MRWNDIVVRLATVVIVGAIGPERTLREDGSERRSGTRDAVAKAIGAGREVWVPPWLRDDQYATLLQQRCPQVRVIEDPVGELTRRLRVSRAADCGEQSGTWRQRSLGDQLTAPVPDRGGVGAQEPSVPA
jgi:hypothetical protein